MSILEKLQTDMEDDAYFNLPLQERYDLLKRDAETIAKRLDAVVKMLEPGEKPDYPDARMAVWKAKRALYARACEIAGRKE